MTASYQTGLTRFDDVEPLMSYPFANAFHTIQAIVFKWGVKLPGKIRRSRLSKVKPQNDWLLNVKFVGKVFLPYAHELRTLRRLRREQKPKSSFVFTSERESPFSTSGFAKMIARVRYAELAADRFKDSGDWPRRF
jgi:hypothetical protein